MTPSRYPRQIISTPLSEVWNEQNEIVATEREADLNERDIRNLLRQSALQFVVADVGKPPHWIPIAETFDFWKSEARPHLSEPNGGALDISAFPDQYCYLATRWRWDENTPLVVLLKFH